MVTSVNGRNPDLDGLSYDERKARYLYPEGFFVASIAVLARLLQNRALGLEALSVLGFLFEHCKRSNRVEATQAHIAERLGIKPPNVARAFRALEREKLLIKVREPHGFAFWYLDARAVYRGSAKAHEAALQRQARQRERDKRSNVRQLRPSA